jgi:hypothetical protein
MLLGTLLLYSVDWFLFNKKRRHFLGMHIPLTPGFVVRMREWLFNKARDLLHDYLEQAENKQDKSGYLSKWEQKVRDVVYEKAEFVNGWPLLPQKLKDKIRNLLADSVKEIASKILRRTVPHLIEQWRVEHRIDEFDAKFDVAFLKKYWRKYVFKYSLWFFWAINFLIGIMNMIWFLILV